MWAVFGSGRYFVLFGRQDYFLGNGVNRRLFLYKRRRRW